LTVFAPLQAANEDQNILKTQSWGGTEESERINFIPRVENNFFIKQWNRRKYLMRVHWLVAHPNSGNFNYATLKQHNLASVRLRAGALLEYSRTKKGCPQIFFGEQINWEGTDVLVIGKVGADNRSGRFEKWLQAVKMARSLGVRTVLDYTDDHLSVPTAMSEFYREAINLVDAFVASSDYLRNDLSQRVKNKISIIEDAVEYGLVPPKPKLVGECPALLWFGHSTNIPSLLDGLSRIKSKKSYSINIITNEFGLNMLSQSSLNWADFNKVKFFVWSVDTVFKVARTSDFVIIPSDKAGNSKRGVSKNRLVTSFCLGLPTFADYFQSYSEFSEYFQDFELLSKENPLTFCERGRVMVLQAQRVVCPSFSMVKIGENWADALGASTSL